MERKYKLLIAKRDFFVGQLHKLLELSKNLENEDKVKEFKVNFKNLEKIEETLTNLVEEINDISLKKNEKENPDFSLLDKVREISTQIIISAESIRDQDQREQISGAKEGKPSWQHVRRLPDVPLPKFSGEIQSWTVFKECFESLIHNNRDLSDVEKIHYLVGSLSGKALSVCTGIPPTANNYEIIWQSLKDKFDDQRIIANFYLDQIMSFKQSPVENANSLSYFIENFHSTVQALKNLKIPDLSDYILAHLAFTRLPPQTQRALENSKRNTDWVNYKDVLDFVKEQMKICLRSDASTNSKFDESHRNKNSKISRNFFANENNKDKCILCSHFDHNLMRCPKFLEKTPQLRYNFVKDKNLCLNCLSFHKISNCRSPGTCKSCGSRHHSLLHFERRETQMDKGSATSSEKEICKDKTLSLITFRDNRHVHSKDTTVLLSTVQINVRDKNGYPRRCRFLIDSGSQANFLTQRCFRSLGLKCRPYKTRVHGLGSVDARIQGCVTLELSSRFGGRERHILDAMIVEKIVDELPVVAVDRNMLSHLNEVPLADPKFHIPGKIDGILGSDLMGRILRNQKIAGPHNSPIAVETSLGFIVMGSAPVRSIEKNSSTHAFCGILKPNSLKSLVERFWEMEDVPPEKTASVSPESEVCETLFSSTHRRDQSGRFIVKLPFSSDQTLLGDSYQNARHRFLQLENKFYKNPKYRTKYSEVIRDYINQGHMSKCTDTDVSTSGYFIPHHGVFKADSSTTPLRVVFDGSCKTNSNYSLNDILYSGPKLQSDLVSVLLNFRLKPIGISADLKQMFRQILVDEDDRKFQKILWRFSPSDSLKTYSLNTVTFGLKSSPYLALRVLQQLAEEAKTEFPNASEMIKRDMYVDDLVASVDDLESAIDLYHELIEVFRRGGFQLVKWSTSSSELRRIIPVENRLDHTVDFQKTCLKVLGMLWSPDEDMLHFKFDLKPQNKICSKRNILSVVARCYDPLGFLAPVILLAKLIIKDLWQLKLGWDDKPPDDIVSRWNSLCLELPTLARVKIPRFVGVLPGCAVMLIGFADACSSSYGAAVYLRAFDSQNSTHSYLLYAKTKVAPSKSLTIPKLELCSTHLLAKVLKFVIACYRSRINIKKIYALSDSTIALSWIRKHPSNLDTFVANRVSSIQSLIPTDSWFHVPSKENASDLLSRGQTPNRLVNNPDWFRGPAWLASSPEGWPIKAVRPFEQAEKSKVALTVVKSQENRILEFIGRQSRWSKLLRSMVFILRFVKILPIREGIDSSDLETSELCLIRLVQNLHFGKEIRILEQNGMPHDLRHLRPFLKDSIIRVGGRLKNANLEFDSRHPILLPKRDPLVNLLIDHYHATNFHTGPHLTLALLRTRYWILSARSIVRTRIKTCNFCFRFRPKNSVPVMGNLPSSRVQQAKAFLKTGCDYAGPISIIPYRKRGVRSVKAYICLFVCMVTKAIHLELVSDLTTQCFLQAFKRFISRRGVVRDIYSDNGTNFIGAKAELDSLYRLLKSSTHNKILGAELSAKGINWHLIPPQAPHMGGLWESSVKLVKSHLFKGTKDQLLTYEEMTTILAQIEALINSRPLCVLSSDPSDPTALTPAHFLTLGPIEDLPALDLTGEKISRLTRFQLLDNIIQNFWKRWHLEYLSSLLPRQKWNTDANPIEKGTVVLLEIPHLPPLQWPLGVIQETYPGTDQIVRVVDIKTKSGIFKRPVSKIYPLPLQ